MEGLVEGFKEMEGLLFIKEWLIRDVCSVQIFKKVRW